MSVHLADSKKIKLTFLFAWLLMYGNAQTKEVSLIIEHVNIVDVLKNTIIPNQTICIDGEVIVAIGNGKIIAKKFSSPQTIDGKNKFIMPSLWDMHVHFGGDTLIEENKMLLPLYVAMGVSHVRDCAGDISLSVLQWKKEIAENRLFGPTIFTSGPKIEGMQSIWPGDLEIADEAGLVNALDSLQRLKVDFVKITDNTLDPELFLKSIQASKERGFKVTGHIPATKNVELFSRAGLSAIEHIGYLLRSASADEDQITQLRAAGKITAREASERYINSFDSVIAMNKFRQLALNGTAVVPTINGSQITAYLDLDNHLQDDYLKYLGPALKRTYDWRVQRAAKDNKQAIDFRHKNFEASARLLPLLYQAGVTIIAGTDAGYLNSFNYPGLGIHHELAIMVNYGLTPQQALACSVINGPAFFQQSDSYGSVAENKKADLLLLQKNPLLAIENTQSIEAVVRKGSYLNRKQLDAMLKSIEEEVKKLK